METKEKKGYGIGEDITRRTVTIEKNAKAGEGSGGDFSNPRCFCVRLEDAEKEGITTWPRGIPLSE